jgi:hypothetical protein
MSTFKEKACLQVTDPHFLKDNKSKTIELLKLRQCRNTCCAKIYTDKRAEELVDRGFATTLEEHSSKTKEGSLGTSPIHTEIDHEGSGEFTVILDTAVGPIVPTFNPAKNLSLFLYEVNGGGTLVGAELRLSDSPGQPQRLKDTQTISGLISGDVITYKTTLLLDSDSTGKKGETVLETGAFTIS